MMTPAHHNAIDDLCVEFETSLRLEHAWLFGTDPFPTEPLKLLEQRLPAGASNLFS